MNPRPGARRYTVDGAAPSSAVAAACRGALVALRPVLDMICVELPADFDWPDEETRSAVTGRRVRPKRWSFGHRRRGGADIAADLWARDPAQFNAALTIAADTGFALAIATSGHAPYYVNDIDGVRRFELTDDELSVAVDYIAREGQNASYVIPDSS